MNNNPFIRIWRAIVSEIPISLALFILFLIPSFLPPTLLFNEVRFQPSLVAVILIQPIFYVVVLALLSHLHRWIWWSSLVIVSIGTMVDVGCYISQGTNLTSVLLSMMLQTNLRETCEFLSNPHLLTGLVSGVICLGLYMASVYFADRAWKQLLKQRKYRMFTLRPVISTILGVMLCLVSLLSAYVPFRIIPRNYMVDFVNMDHSHRPIGIPAPVAYYFVEQQRRQDALQLEGLVNENARVKVTPCADDSLNIILVIGESHNKHRCNLYGYQKTTYPYMKEQVDSGRLIAYNNIITYMPFTRYVMPYFFTPLHVLGGEPYDSAPLLPAIIKKGGYETSLFCNQQLIKKYLFFDQSCYLFLNSEDVRNQCFDRINDEIFEYDGDFVDAYPTPTSSPRSFTIYNLMGQHDYAKARYPSGFGLFRPEDYSHLQKFNDIQFAEMSEYDNASLYNDYVLNKIISGVADKKAVVIYVPYHGEESFDYRDFKVRKAFDYAPGTVKCEYEVPMFIWCSDKFIQGSPEKFSQLKSNVDKPLYNTDIAHTIMDLACVRTCHYDPCRSLLTDSLMRGHRLIGVGGDFDYDSNKETIDDFKLIY